MMPVQDHYTAWYMTALHLSACKVCGALTHNMQGLDKRTQLICVL